MDHRDKWSWGAPRCQTRGTRGHSGVHQGGRPHRQDWPSWGSVPFPLALQDLPSPTHCHFTLRPTRSRLCCFPPLIASVLSCHCLLFLLHLHLSCLPLPLLHSPPPPLCLPLFLFVSCSLSPPCLSVCLSLHLLASRCVSPSASHSLFSLFLSLTLCVLCVSVSSLLFLPPSPVWFTSSRQRHPLAQSCWICNT